MRTLALICVLALAPMPCMAEGNGAGGTEAAHPVKQDANLYRVDAKLYRSEQPVADDAELLRTLGIRSVVNLRYFSRGRNARVFGGHQGIELINRPLLAWRVRPADIARVLYTIERQQEKGAVLVHCYHGADRTGIIVAMYRIIYQGWTAEAAKREMTEGGFGYHSIWKNLERLFDEKTVSQVRGHLDALRTAENGGAETR